MDYFEIFDLGVEPFSNSPDPDFFYRSRQYAECLNRIEIAIRLRRGLSVVLGDVGVGKSTLCRQLLRSLDSDESVMPLLFLDPYFSSPAEFLRVLASMLGAEPDKDASEWQLRECVKNSLFSLGIEEKKTVVLLLDEGQKINETCLELLREFLNYETNAAKLLQIVIFAQTEFAETVKRFPNFADRINETLRLEPLRLGETVAMIRFRLGQARTGGAGRDPFTWPAYWAIQRATGGYPRKIISLCHRALLTLVIQNRTRAGLGLIRALGRDHRPNRLAWVGWAAAAAACGFAVFLLLSPDAGERLASLRQAWRTASTAMLPAGHNQPAPDAHENAPTAPEAPQAGGVGPGSIQAAEAAVPPATLGSLVIDQIPLARAMARVYGAYDPRYFNATARLNPRIKNLNALSRGESVNLPALPAAPGSGLNDSFWLRLDGSDSLEQAFGRMRDLRLAGVKARLLPHWGPRAGLKFEVVLSGGFASRGEAEAGLAALPQHLRARAEVLGDWEPGEVFFSAPRHASGE